MPIGMIFYDKKLQAPVHWSMISNYIIPNKKALDEHVLSIAKHWTSISVSNFYILNTKWVHVVEIGKFWVPINP